MIKNIVFDMGNVIIKFNPKEIVNNYTKNNEDKKILLDIVFYGQEWLDLDRGTLELPDAIKQIREKLPINLKDTGEKILKTWTEYISEDDKMKNLMKDLKKKGYNTYILSNAPYNMFKYLSASEIPSLVDGMVISCEEKTSKPEEEIYNRLFTRFNLKPEESFFIDDREPNIKASKKLGMDGHIYDMNNIEDLISDLKKHEINI